MSVPVDFSLAGRVAAVVAGGENELPDGAELRATSAAAARLVTINETGFNTFHVYITNGSYQLVDNDFIKFGSAMCKFKSL